jgi:hypothetical protein
MNEFIKQVIHHSGGALWNNGSYGQRDMKGKPGSLSVHATGRAVDMSYRGSARHPQSSRKSALPFVEKLVANANELGTSYENIEDAIGAALGTAENDVTVTNSTLTGLSFN